MPGNSRQSSTKWRRGLLGPLRVPSPLQLRPPHLRQVRRRRQTFSTSLSASAGSATPECSLRTSSRHRRRAYYGRRRNRKGRRARRACQRDRSEQRGEVSFRAGRYRDAVIRSHSPQACEARRQTGRSLAHECDHVVAVDDVAARGAKQQPARHDCLRGISAACESPPAILPLRPDCTSGHLRVLAGSGRSSKRWRKSGEIPDRLLTIASDRPQLANAANGQTTAFAQKEEPQAA